MSLYNISVKAEPDWAIGSNVDQNESRNSIDGSAHASDQRIKKENENSSNVDMKLAAAKSSSNEPAAAGVPGEALRVATPGYHRRSNWYSKERSSNFSKQECQLLRAIIDKYSEILFNKKTDTATNLKKKAIWVKIEAEFNAVSPNKRTLRQLQAKLDNMKRNRRKKERSEANSLTKVVVIPRLAPPTNDSDDRLSLNTTTNDRESLHTMTDDCESLDTMTNGDLSLDAFTDVDEQAFNVEVQIAELEPSQEPHSTAAVTDPIPVECTEMHSVPASIPPPPSPPGTRVSRARARARTRRTRGRTASQPRFRKRAKQADTEYERNQKLRQTKLEAIHCTREYDRILFETRLQHLEEKRREDREIYELKKRKLELEISLLEKQNKH
ncbi:uncharacterized protein LOC134753643 isoform X2 [Cydia strobilella]|uniref:uncharacterized protein LOC134753643 isoform X2 n=1 Tax=Cydia strobilella TaxID=1100964 RepID=UPI003004FC98